MNKCVRVCPTLRRRPSYRSKPAEHRQEPIVTRSPIQARQPQYYSSSGRVLWKLSFLSPVVSGHAGPASVGYGQERTQPAPARRGALVSSIPVKRRMSLPHVPRYRPRDINPHQLSLSNPRAPLPRFSPVPCIPHQFRPEGKRRALKRFRRMHRTPAVLQKPALRMSRHAQPAKVPRPVNIALLERRHAQFEERGQARNIVLGQIDEALLFAAFRAAGLALEAHELSAV